MGVKTEKAKLGVAVAMEDLVAMAREAPMGAKGVATGVVSVGI